MLLYNVTVSIDKSIKEDWVSWMKKKHIPDVMNTGCFLEARIARVHGEEEGGLTFAITYLCKNQEDYDRYVKEHSSDLQREHSQKYNGSFAAFRTMLTVLQEFKNDC